LVLRLPDADILIAAHAIELDATLVTDNVRHFEVFLSQGLRAENWVER
jgi:tRNA(fMet)-specific endonuclease VapC